MKVENWKNSEKLKDAKEKLENQKVRSILSWIFSILVTLAFAALVAIAMKVENWKNSEKLKDAKEKLENQKVRSILSWIFSILVTLAFAALVAIAIFQSVTMQESSMEPTLSVGDRYFMDRVTYRLSSPKRGDLIVFRTNASDEAALHIRRVIGEPTLSVGDRYFMDRVTYRLSSPKRGDLIVFRTNASDEAALHIRRVIGLPGETVQITEGRILINGETYKEGRDFPSISNPGMAASPVTLESGEYFLPGETVQITEGRILINGETYKEGRDFPSISNPGMAASPVTLESGEYFVLGDNRNNSEDSRYGDIGKVKKKYIVGKLWFTISPLKKIGFVKG